MSPSSEAARARLAAQQGAVLRALWRQSEAPDGFDPHQLQIAGSSLLGKRRRALGNSWPGLKEALGADFVGLTERYVATIPLPRYGGPLADGRRFLTWLDTHAPRPVPNTVRLQALAIDLRFDMTEEGFVPRGRRLVLRWTTFRGPPRVVVGFRCPPFGDRWVSFPPWPKV